MTSYQRKLQDPRWQKKRLKVLERDKWQCQWYEDFDNNALHVHHIEYFKGDPWDIPNKLLDTVCYKCHKNLKDKNYRYVLVSEYRKHNFGPIGENSCCANDGGGCLAFAGFIKVNKNKIYVRCSKSNCEW